MARFRVSHSWAPNFGFKLVAAALREAGAPPPPDLSCVRAHDECGRAGDGRRVRRLPSPRGPAAARDAAGVWDGGDVHAHHVLQRLRRGRPLRVRHADLRAPPTRACRLPGDDEAGRGARLSTSARRRRASSVRVVAPPREVGAAPTGDAARAAGRRRADSRRVRDARLPPPAPPRTPSAGRRRPGRLLDLGVLHRGRLDLTGRAKEVVIVCGANYAPRSRTRRRPSPASPPRASPRRASATRLAGTEACSSSLSVRRRRRRSDCSTSTGSSPRACAGSSSPCARSRARTATTGMTPRSPRAARAAVRRPSTALVGEDLRPRLHAAHRGRRRVRRARCARDDLALGAQRGGATARRRARSTISAARACRPAWRPANPERREGDFFAAPTGGGAPRADARRAQRGVGDDALTSRPPATPSASTRTTPRAPSAPALDNVPGRRTDARARAIGVTRRRGRPPGRGRRRRARGERVAAEGSRASERKGGRRADGARQRRTRAARRSTSRRSGSKYASASRANRTLGRMARRRRAPPLRWARGRRRRAADDDLARVAHRVAVPLEFVPELDDEATHGGITLVDDRARRRHGRDVPVGGRPSCAATCGGGRAVGARSKPMRRRRPAATAACCGAAQDVVTGGLGALGREVVRLLVDDDDCAGGHVLVIGRRAPATPPRSSPRSGPPGASRT